MAAGVYEHNWQYYTRNTWTTLAIGILSVYVISTGHGVSKELLRFDQFKSSVRFRVNVLSALMVTVLCLRLIMIWSQNFFWYSDSQYAWLIFVVIY